MGHKTPLLHSTSLWNRISMNLIVIFMSHEFVIILLCSFQWKNCDEVYGLKDHLYHHLQTVHMQQNTRLYRCQWKGCNDWVSSEDNGKVWVNYDIRKMFSYLYSMQQSCRGYNLLSGHQPNESFWHSFLRLHYGN